jgi:chromosome segregation ATPase
MDVTALVVGVVAALFGGGVGGAITTAVSRRAVTRAEAAEQLTDSAIELLNTVKADTRADLTAMRAELADARREAAEYRRETAEVRQQLRQVTMDAELLVGYMNRVVAAIQDPQMTMERLRTLVGSGPPNGAVRTAKPLTA